MEFNKNQQEIINSIAGAHLISAPVGTGKTTVLTERIVGAIASGIKPDEILCLTFTNRAADEMRARIKKRINKPEISNRVFIGTFHGFCSYFIRAEAKAIGISRDFTICDEVEQQEILKKILEKRRDNFFSGKNEKFEIMQLLDSIYRRRLTGLEKRIGCKVAEIAADDYLDAIGEEYRKNLEEQNSFDFNELVLLTLETLYFDQKIQKKWSERFKFIQLDEFQDTHLSEYLVIKELAKKHGNISLIGDLDQTIYSWRGSEPFFVAKLFCSHFSPVREMHLEINYRFDQNILAAIKSFLVNIEKRATKKIESSRLSEGDKKCVKVFAGYDFSEEAYWVIDSIQKIKETDPLAKISVLSRANNAITRLADIFEKKGVAHITVDKYDFFRRQEIKDVFSYLKILFNKYDLESAYRIIARPSRGIGDATLKKIKEDGEQCGLKISDFLDFKNFNFSEPYFNLLNIWQNGRMIVLDTETTGINPSEDEVIQIYAVEVINGKPGKDFHYFLKNTKPVGVSEKVHGISDEFLKNKGEDPEKILRALKEFIAGDIVSGHNVNFDLNMLLENGKRKGVVFDFKEYYDSLDLARRLIASENYKLNTLAKKFGLAQATHDAKDDVLATIGLLDVLIDKLKSGQEKRKEIFEKFKSKFIKLASEIDFWKKEIKNLRPLEALNFIWTESGLCDYYSHDSEKDKRLKSFEILKEVFAAREDLEKPGDAVLRELINFSSLARDVNFLGIEKGKVPIVTVHQVKGLEFDYVFIVGLNEYKFPIYKSDLEEEKRLFYVALTRAKKRIYLSYSRFDEYGRNMAPSRFIGFLNGEYLENIN